MTMRTMKHLYLWSAVTISTQEKQWLHIHTVHCIIFYRQSPQHMPDFDNVRPLATAEIVSRDSKLEVKVSHDMPALLAEWYPIRVILKNKENYKITVISANVNLQTSGDDPNIEQSSKFLWVPKSGKKGEFMNKSEYELPVLGNFSRMLYFPAHAQVVLQRF